MKINKGLLFSMAVVMLASVFAYGAAQGIVTDGGDSIAAYADTEDPDTFDAVVHYNDKIQITYLVMNKDGTFTQGPGDIQLGVLNAGGQTVIRQLYCAAATVHFHTSSIITHPAGQPYVDEANGYVIATPDRADVVTNAQDLARNMKQVTWLVANGYYGDNTGLSVNNASVKDLEARYPAVGLSDTPNRAEIAVIATKISIWHYTDPMVAILSTSLSRGDQIKMYALVKALIADADAYAKDDSPASIGMQMDLEIDNSAAGFTTIAATSVGLDKKYYYGPLTVKSSSDDIQSNLDEIFLTFGGRQYGSSRFVKDEGGLPTTAALDKDTVYGYPELTTTDENKEPYINKDDKFWIEASSASCPDLSGVTINAEARSNGVTYTKATPQLVVYGASNGAQDWEEVQAFVGLMEAGAKGDIYGRATLELQGGIGLAPGHVSVTKIMLDIDGNVVEPKAGDEFTVQLVTFPSSNNKTFVLNKGNEWTSSAAVENGRYMIIEDEASLSKGYRYKTQSSLFVDIDNDDDATSAAAVWVENEETSGTVIINKTVRNAEGAAVTPLDRDLFVVYLDGVDKDVTVGFKNATGYSSGEIKLPVGEYKVSEILDNRYSRIDDTETISVEADKTTILNVVNRQHEGEIKIKKIVKINGQEVMPSSVSSGDVFTVTITDEADANNLFTVTLNSANNWEETVSGIPAGDYRVSETVGGDGWEVSYSSSSVNVTDGSSHDVTVTNSKTITPVTPNTPDTPNTPTTPITPSDNTPSDNTPSDNNNNGDNDNDDDDNDDDGGDSVGNDDEDNGESGGSADTSDQMPLGLWTWLLCISGASIIAAAILNRSRTPVTGVRSNRRYDRTRR